MYTPKTHFFQKKMKKKLFTFGEKYGSIVKYVEGELITWQRKKIYIM